MTEILFSSVQDRLRFVRNELIRAKDAINAGNSEAALSALDNARFDLPHPDEIPTPRGSVTPETKRAILEAYADNPKMKHVDIAKQVGTSPATVGRVIAAERERLFKQAYGSKD